MPKSRTLSSAIVRVIIPVMCIGVVAIVAFILGANTARFSDTRVVKDTNQTPDTGSQVVAYANSQAAKNMVSGGAEQVQRLEAAFEAERFSLQTEIKALRADLLRHIEQRDNLAVTLNQLDHQLLIDRTAYEKLSDALEGSSREVTRLRQEVDFYRSLVSPSEDQKGLQVSGFRLLPTVDESVWSLSLVLVQTVKHTADTHGELSIEIEGREADIKKVVEASTLGAQYDTDMRFKFYHRIHSEITVPGEFSPERIGVMFKEKGQHSPALSQWYIWPSNSTG